MTTVFAFPGGAAAAGPASGGKCTPVNNVGTTGAQVVAANGNRQSITFCNPGSVAIYIYPMSVPVTSVALGGSVPLGAGGIVTLQGECQGAFGALAASGSGNPLTILESNI